MFYERANVTSFPLHILIRFWGGLVYARRCRLNIPYRRVIGSRNMASIAW